jgi:copper(I)-binding protein
MAIARRTMFFAALALPAMAQTAPAVQQPWARASAGQAANGAAYLTFANQGAADRLVAAASPVARRVELHTHINDNGVMRMREVEGGIAVPQGTTTLRPGGLHVMLMGLHQPLREGESFPLTLRFASGAEVTVQVPVRGAAASGAGHRHAH